MVWPKWGIFAGSVAPQRSISLFGGDTHAKCPVFDFSNRPFLLAGHSLTRQMGSFGHWSLALVSTDPKHAARTVIAHSLPILNALGAR